MGNPIGWLKKKVRQNRNKGPSWAFSLDNGGPIITPLTAIRSWYALYLSVYTVQYR